MAIRLVGGVCKFPVCFLAPKNLHVRCQEEVGEGMGWWDCWACTPFEWSIKTTILVKDNRVALRPRGAQHPKSKWDSEMHHWLVKHVEQHPGVCNLSHEHLLQHQCSFFSWHSRNITDNWEPILVIRSLLSQQRLYKRSLTKSLSHWRYFASHLNEFKWLNLFAGGTSCSQIGRASCRERV